MIMRSILQALAGVTLALMLFIGGATSSQAHTAHEAPVATAVQTKTVAVAPTSKGDVSGKVADDAQQLNRGPASDCAGHKPTSDDGGKSCCSNTCHAAMSTDLVLPIVLSQVVTASPSTVEPSELQGPTIHIKRPPRPIAALVG